MSPKSVRFEILKHSKKSRLLYHVSESEKNRLFPLLNSRFNEYVIEVYASAKMAELGKSKEIIWICSRGGGSLFVLRMALRLTKKV
jgi:hypothetical protein